MACVNRSFQIALLSESHRSRYRVKFTDMQTLEEAHKRPAIC
jgi:hypothetical protein